MIPKISQEAEFRARLKTHLDRIRTGRHFPSVDMVWMGEEAKEFAGLIGEMARFMDEDAVMLIRDAQARRAAQSGNTGAPEIPLERKDGGARAELAWLTDAFREGAQEGKAASVEAGRSVNILRVVEEMERRIYVLLPEILSRFPGAPDSRDIRSGHSGDKNGLPINPLTERDAFLERLAPHMKRIGLSAGFMNMDVAWEGDEATEFATLIERMAAWIDGEATELVCEASAMKARAYGRTDITTVEELRQRNGGGFSEMMLPIVSLLRGGSETGFRAVWRGDGVPAMRELISDLVDRTFNRIPQRIEELREQARLAATAQGDEHPDGPSSP